MARQETAAPLPRGSFEASWRGLRLMALPPGPSAFRLTPERHVIAIQLEAAQHKIAIGRDRAAERTVEAGSVCWVPPGVDFALEGTCRAFNILMELDPAAAAPHAAGDALRDPLELLVDDEIASCAREALGVLLSPLPDPLMVEELGLQVLSRGLALRGEGGAPLRAHGEDRRILAALDYMDDNLGDALSVCAIAGAAAMSPPHFSRLFRQAAGRPVWAYLMERRCERAKAMLRATAEPIAQIAVEAGFHDQAHMTKAFRAMLGITPAAFRTIAAA